jgi:hypothetical protein
MITAALELPNLPALDIHRLQLKVRNFQAFRWFEFTPQLRKLTIRVDRRPERDFVLEDAVTSAVKNAMLEMTALEELVLVEKAHISEGIMSCALQYVPSLQRIRLEYTAEAGDGSAWSRRAQHPPHDLGRRSSHPRTEGSGMSGDVEVRATWRRARNLAAVWHADEIPQSHQHSAEASSTGRCSSRSRSFSHGCAWLRRRRLQALSFR